VFRLKFDLRIYVVVIGHEDTKAYICDEGLARFCTAPYEKPKRENFKKAYMHLTNYSLNKVSEGYTESTDVLHANEASKRSLASLFETMRSEGVDTEAVWANIKHTLTAVTEVYVQMMQHQVCAHTNMKPLAGKMFQILGYDLMLDENLRAWLLEVNDHPSLNINLEKEFMSGRRDGTLSLVDEYVKQRIVGDSIKLAKKRTALPASFGSLQQIYPTIEDETTHHKFFRRIRELFYSVTTIKNKETISYSQFEKLYGKHFESLGIKKADMSVVFQKACGKLRSIDIIGFMSALEGLWGKCGKQGWQGSFADFVTGFL